MMDELLALFPVLFLIYLFQCIAVSPPGTTVFFVDTALRARLLRYSWQVGANERRLFLLNPFSCFRQAMFVTGHPFSFLANSSGEILGINIFGPSEKPLANPTLTFAEPHRFAARLKKLLADDLPFSTLPSERVARRVADFLNKLQAAPLSKRTVLVDRELRHMFSVDAIRERLQLYSRKTALLTTLCFFLFLYIFLVAPSAIFSLGLHRAWPALVTTLVFTAFAIAWIFRRADRALYADSTESNLQHILAITLSPLAAIRAADALAACLLEEFHPVAVAWTTLPTLDFLKFAEMELRTVKFISHDSILENHLTSFLTEQKLNPSSLLAAPSADGPHSRSFCPACLTQFVITEGVCRECGDVPLQPLRPATDR